MRRLLAALVSLAVRGAVAGAAVGGAVARAETPSVSASPAAARPAANVAEHSPVAPAAAPASVEPRVPADPASPSPPSKPVARVKKKRRKPAPPPLPAAQLVAINTHESFTLRPDPKGRITRTQLRGWNRFLRCHHTGRVHAMSTRLAELIYEVDKHFDFKTVVVVAGYRAPRIAREKGNPKSPHKKGVACDFRIDGVPNGDLRDFERTLPRVGVGYYPNSEFVHLDVDPSRVKHSAFWIDYSRPGERARYSKDPNGDLEAEERNNEGETPSPSDLEASPIVPAYGGEEPQAPLLKGAANPNSPPPIFTIPENH